MLIPLLERLGWTSLQTVLLVALVYGACRALPSLSAATRAAGAGRALATAVAAAASAARRSRRDGFCASRLLSPGCSARTSTLPVPRWVMPRRTAAA
ncbi:hypothetical protein G6F58_012899 [Rhizopus delemar]|nr:hypothetical protein G6F58_012899 [Rhizopus delemar]